MSRTANHIHRILIIGPSWVGDMIMAQSLFKALKSDNPDAIIDVLALAWTKPLLERMPEVNQSIEMPVSHGVFGWNMRKKLGKQLREQHYDQAIVLPNSWKSALIPWFARIPVRTGWRGEMRYGLLNDLRILNKTALPLMVQRYVSLAFPASQSHLAPSYPEPVLPTRTPYAENIPAELNGQSRLVLCPGAEFGPAKQWPASYYAEVAQHFARKNWQIVILGSQADRNIAETIHNFIAEDSKQRVVNLAGQTTLEQAIDLIGTADCIVSNDSGLMHIAAATQKPLIALYGPTSPTFTPPLSAIAKIMQIDVDCGPCFQRTCPQQHHHCMQNIHSDRVITATESSISG